MLFILGFYKLVTKNTSHFSRKSSFVISRSVTEGEAATQDNNYSGAVLTKFVYSLKTEACLRLDKGRHTQKSWNEGYPHTTPTKGRTQGQESY